MDQCNGITPDGKRCQRKKRIDKIFDGKKYCSVHYLRMTSKANQTKESLNQDKIEPVPQLIPESLVNVIPKDLLFELKDMSIDELNHIFSQPQN